MFGILMKGLQNNTSFSTRTLYEMKIFCENSVCGALSFCVCFKNTHTHIYNISIYMYNMCKLWAGINYLKFDFHRLWVILCAIGDNVWAENVFDKILPNHEGEVYFKIKINELMKPFMWKYWSRTNYIFLVYSWGYIRK